MVDTNTLFPDWWGLWLGIRGVLWGHLVVFSYHYIRKRFFYPYGSGSTIQQSEPEFDWKTELVGHATRPEAFFMLVPYLSITWMFKLMPVLASRFLEILFAHPIFNRGRILTTIWRRPYQSGTCSYNLPLTTSLPIAFTGKIFFH